MSELGACTSPIQGQRHPPVVWLNRYAFPFKLSCIASYVAPCASILIVFSKGLLTKDARIFSPMTSWCVKLPLSSFDVGPFLVSRSKERTFGELHRPQDLLAKCREICESLAAGTSAWDSTHFGADMMFDASSNLAVFLLPLSADNSWQP